MTPDCLIVGGGLIGLLTARELRAAGMAVTLLERGVVGRESSWAGGGILSPLYPWRYPAAVTVLARWSQQHYRGLAEALHAETGIDAEWTESGLLVLETAEAEAAGKWAAREQMELRLLSADQVADLAPEIGDIETSLWLPKVAQIRNPRLVKALRAGLERSGVQIREGVEVRAVLNKDGRAYGVDTSLGEMHAEHIVVAGGAWTAQLLEPLGIVIPLRPVRGQMLLLRAQPGVVSHLLLQNDHYLIPRRDGRVLAGSTLEDAGFDKTTTDAARGELYAAAVHVVPALADYPIEQHWAGLRPGTPAGVPYIGAGAHCAGLWINTGHFRNGVVLAPGSARLLADLMLEREPIVPMAPYRPPAVTNPA